MNLTPINELSKAISLSRPNMTMTQPLRLPQDVDTVRFSATKKASSVDWKKALDFYNGYGGFSKDGREYVVVLDKGKNTPVPWSNVVANGKVGFLATEAGSGFSWGPTASETRISPMSADWVSDPPGEAFYIRDEQSGKFWSPTALPARDDNTYIARHGRGYSRFEHAANGIKSDLLQFVAKDDPVKLSKLTLENTGDAERQLSISNYVELVMGGHRSKTAHSLKLERDAETGAIFFQNPSQGDFAYKVGFLDFAQGKTTAITDRQEFLGRLGDLASPAAMVTGEKSQKGYSNDPCSVLQTKVTLAPKQKTELVALMGQADSVDEARALVKKFRVENTQKVFQQSVDRVESALQKIQVKTPDKSLDLMLNGWLLNQAISGRFLGRSGFYQSGGGYGYRDQLQDVMSMVYARPDFAKAHIEKAASRQFKEGDVQHWFLVPSGKGVRTTFSDDLLWLPLVTSRYVKATGDKAFLDKQIPFVEGPVLKDGEVDVFFQPTISKDTSSLYDHCKRAINRSLDVGFGEHGLPLMGIGDWNDGMNEVGRGGKGESVWVGWFLLKNIGDFIGIAKERGDTETVKRWEDATKHLKGALENAWDGEWYRRAYFDNGDPLGSKENDECKIDGIAQTWAVISGQANPARAKQAMKSVEKMLVNAKHKMIHLFTPAFDKAKNHPGYIKAYVPGVRENGGQYTHAAIWTVVAEAMLGNGDKAAQLFNMLNPVNHALNKKEADHYKVEPYVVAADVYGVEPHTGRGGWTWYTGSASWLYQAGLESVLGFQVQDGNKLAFNPAIPKKWDGFEVAYKHGENTTYNVQIKNPNHVSTGVASVTVDGQPVAAQDKRVTMVDDGKAHNVIVTMG